MSVKSIPTTSMAKVRSKEDRKQLRRHILEHGSTDADDIEDKRQHSALQLIKLGETVNKLNRHRILMEQEGEKKIEQIRDGFAAQRKVNEANPAWTPEKLAEFDRRVALQLEGEAIQLSAVCIDQELRTAGLSAQMMIIDALNLNTDCLSLRERSEDEDGKKTLERVTVAAVLSDILLGMDNMNEKVDHLTATVEELIAGIKEATESAAAESASDPIKNKPIPHPIGTKP